MRPSIFRLLSCLAASIALTLSTADCTESSSSGTASVRVGTSGGSVASDDGAVTVVIPAGALASDTTITVTKTTSPASGNLGAVYEIGPTGTHFAKPVSMTFHYASVPFGSTPVANLRVATVVSGAWQALDGFAEDTSAKTVTGTTTHLSPYTVISGSGQICVDLNEPQICMGGTGIPTTCTPSTCALLSGGCATYPGSQLSCTDSSAGADALCCFPNDAPVCGTFSEGCHGGLGTGACLSCASSTGYCAQTVPGSSQQSCTGESGGTMITVVCCMPPGTPLPSTGSGGGGGMGGLSH
jgi:hypothetical protein